MEIFVWIGGEFRAAARATEEIVGAAPSMLMRGLGRIDAHPADRIGGVATVRGDVVRAMRVVHHQQYP
jgi:hypothetical protein